MPYPIDVLFDIETLINVAQPERILLLGDCDPAFLETYVEQKSLLGQMANVTHVRSDKIFDLAQLKTRFDVAIAVDLFEHIDKQAGVQILSRLRDILSAQYCISLPLGASQSEWKLTDLFSFALKRVANYSCDGLEYGLFKYDISDYKNTPDWLNADNWANPNMWNKYRW